MSFLCHFNPSHGLYSFPQLVSVMKQFIQSWFVFIPMFYFFHFYPFFFLSLSLCSFFLSFFFLSLFLTAQQQLEAATVNLVLFFHRLSYHKHTQHKVAINSGKSDQNSQLVLSRNLFIPCFILFNVGTWVINALVVVPILKSQISCAVFVIRQSCN